MPFNVLTFDGGGVRGAFSARLLERLAAEVPSVVHEAMLLAGTSTGGIIALGLAHGLGPGGLVKLYRDNATAIFDHRFAGGVWNAKYDSDGLRKVLTDTFDEATLGELRRWVLVPTLDLDAPSKDGLPRRAKAKFFESKRDADARVVDVALATSAAPTYFPSHLGYVDGGLVANSPSIHAAALALSYGIPPEQIRVLSVGTGISPNFIEGERLDWGGIQWATRIATTMIDGVSGVSDYIARQVLGTRYHRLDGVLSTAVELDDVEAVEDLVAMADSVDLAPTIEWVRQSGWCGERLVA